MGKITPEKVQEYANFLIEKNNGWFVVGTTLEHKIGDVTGEHLAPYLGRLVIIARATLEDLLNDARHLGVEEQVRRRADKVPYRYYYKVMTD